MSWDDAAKLITALVAASGTIAALYRWAVAQGKRDALADQVEKTIAAQDAEIAELKAENAQLESWIDALTTPGKHP